MSENEQENYQNKVFLSHSFHRIRDYVLKVFSWKEDPRGQKQQDKLSNKAGWLVLIDDIVKALKTVLKR